MTETRHFGPHLQKVLERLGAKTLSRRQAAKELKIGYATLKRLIEAQAKDSEQKAV